MVLRLLKQTSLGLFHYKTISLSPHAFDNVTFAETSSYKVKIKVVKSRSISYHDSGNFSVTCDSKGYTQGTMYFSMSQYGSGLGPEISAEEFESNN